MLSVWGQPEYGAIRKWLEENRPESAGAVPTAKCTLFSVSWGDQLDRLPRNSYSWARFAIASRPEEATKVSRLSGSVRSWWNGGKE